MLAKDAREGAMAEEPNERRDGGLRSFAAGLMIGALIGAGLALMLAPQSGEETRRLLRRRARRIADETRDRYDDAVHELRRARGRRRREHDEVSGG
jgi:gas vesicle protein